MNTSDTSSASFNVRSQSPTGPCSAWYHLPWSQGPSPPEAKDGVRRVDEQGEIGCRCPTHESVRLAKWRSQRQLWRIWQQEKRIYGLLWLLRVWRLGRKMWNLEFYTCVERIPEYILTDFSQALPDRIFAGPREYDFLLELARRWKFIGISYPSVMMRKKDKNLKGKKTLTSGVKHQLSNHIAHPNNPEISWPFPHHREIRLGVEMSQPKGHQEVLLCSPGAFVSGIVPLRGGGGLTRWSVRCRWGCTIICTYSVWVLDFNDEFWRDARGSAHTIVKQRRMSSNRGR